MTESDLLLFVLILAALLRNYFFKRPSGAPLHTLSNLYDVPVCSVPPPPYFDAVYCFYMRSPKGGCCSIKKEMTVKCSVHSRTPGFVQEQYLYFTSSCINRENSKYKTISVELRLVLHINRKHSLFLGTRSHLEDQDKLCCVIAILRKIKQYIASNNGEVTKQTATSYNFEKKTLRGASDSRFDYMIRDYYSAVYTISWIGFIL